MKRFHIITCLIFLLLSIPALQACKSNEEEPEVPTRNSICRNKNSNHW